MDTKKFIPVTLLCMLFSCIMYAQTNNPNLPDQQLPVLDNCRTLITPATINMEMQRDQAAYRQLLEDRMTNMPEMVTEFTVQIHIVRRDDGTGGIAVQTIRDEIEDWVNPYFAAVNTSFRECGPENYINSSAWFSLSGDAEGDAMAAANNVADVINIYFVDDPDGACGWARFPWDLPVDYIVIANGCADNQSTIVHELGHYFGLYHTHETAFGAENVTRDNANSCYDCDTDGDRLCDTPADPTLSSGSVTISAAPACAYSSSLTDGCGVSYAPDPTNIMSYSLKECRTFFSTQQKAKMSLTITSAPGSPLYGRNYLETSCPCAMPVAMCKNITVNLDANGNASITPADVDNGSTFDCGFDSWSLSKSSFDCGDVGANSVTLTVEDALGNVDDCQATVTIADVTNPTLSNSAANMTVECDGSGNTTDFANWLSSHAGATASDACGGSWSDNSVPFVYGCGGTGSQTVTFTFTDPSGNSVSTTATFSIVDETKPVVNCPADIHLPECVETATWTATATDLCSDVTIVSNPPSGSVFAKGTTTIVEVTGTDECGNTATCTFTVTRDPDLEVSIDPLATSSLNTCALGTAANIVLGYGNGPTCVTMNATGSGGHGPYTYSWAAPAEVPAGYFTDENTASPTFCAEFQTVACASYTFTVTITDSHGCTETNDVQVSVINPICAYGNNVKIGVCHRPPGNPSNEQSNCLSSKAVSTHLSGHPDCLGGCEDACASYSARMISPLARNEEVLKQFRITVQPNPFNTMTVIRLASDKDVKAKLVISDFSGRVLSSPFDGQLSKDTPVNIDFDASQLKPGVYIARLIGNDGMVTNATMVIVR